MYFDEVQPIKDKQSSLQENIGASFEPRSAVWWLQSLEPQGSAPPSQPPI